jgi:hypothetical protein
MFSHEKLEVYRMAVSFDVAAGKLIPRRRSRALRDQIERGLVSAADYQQCRVLLLSIVRILTKLSAPSRPLSLSLSLNMNRPQPFPLWPLPVSTQASAGG